MNAIIVLTVLLGVICFSHQQDNLLQQLHNARSQCSEESKVDKNLIRKALQDGDFEDDSNLKCFFKCVFVKMGRMTESGEIDIETLKKQVPPNTDQAKASAAIDKCKDVKATDVCEKAFTIAKCLREALGPIKHD